MDIKEASSAAECVLEELESIGKHLGGYIGGSLTAGLGNSTSDIDLFVIVEAAPDLRERVKQYVAYGKRVDVETFTIEEANSMLDLIENFEVLPDQLVKLDSSLKEPMDWYTRLVTSIPLGQADAVNNLKARAFEILPKAQHLLVSYWALYSDGYLEDFNGAIDPNSNPGTACMAAQQMVALAGKSLLAARGDVYYPPKWVYSQIDRTLKDHFAVKDFRTFQTGLWYEQGRTSDDVVAFVQLLWCLAVLELFYPESTNNLALMEQNTLKQSNPEVFRRARGGVPFKVVPGSILLHFELERQVQLSFFLFLIWTIADGESEDSIIELARRYLNGIGMKMESNFDSNVRKALSVLLEKDLVSTN